MKPEVFVGVLLFLIAAALAYKFGSWIGALRDCRKQRTKPSATSAETAEKHSSLAQAPSITPAERPAPDPMTAAMASSAAAQPISAATTPAIESVLSASPPMQMPSSAMVPPGTTAAATAAPLPKSAKPSAPATPVTKYGSPALLALAERALSEHVSSEHTSDAHPKPDIRATLPPGASFTPKAKTEPQPVAPSSGFNGPRPDVQATLPPVNRI